MQPGQSPGGSALRASLGSVMHHNAGKWLRFIASILKNKADAEDVMQEAVRRVLVRDLPFGTENEVRLYLGKAIGNAALELYNCNKRSRLRHFPVNEQILLPAHANPFILMTEMERKDEQEQLFALLDEGLKHLPAKQYEALRLTILDSRGLSIRDVGATSGIPYSTLRHRTRQGLRGLRRFIESQRRIRKIP